ncbi:Tex family protein [Litoribacillus peritrichatus]|uniref:Tex family protein n=1 Tax=Litoribacillus peritrichatus TaxID=718191 RepID=A0ABP7NDZ9_9GAMM
MDRIYKAIANELNIRQQQVEAAVALLDEGATVPFIARYRKEVTGALDDSQLRNLEDRLRYLRELEDRRITILKSIEEQGKLTDELIKDIEAADTKNRLEDLYLPYKKKRRTKAQIAREAGLEPLADVLYEIPASDPEKEATKYVDPENSIADTKAALDGAKYILMERFSENANLLEKLRHFLWQEGTLSVRVIEGKENEGAKFRDYFEHDEPLKSVPSHRALAILRGRNEGILNFNIVAGNPEIKRSPCEQMIADFWLIEDKGRAADTWLQEVVRWTWRVKLLTHLETELMGKIRETAENEAIKVFSQNLKDLLLAAPAGPRATLGLDPGFRTGVKVAAIDATGKVVDHGAIFPHEPQRKWDQAIQILAALCKKHAIELISIGNGTASRETDKLAGELMKKHPELKLTKIVVSEAGASVYSASEFAAKEFPDLDVTIRGAVSIARRLQDPLAELVKIEPKSIGVGQYQHDVSQVELARSLDTVIEDCVNGVGVDLNTASAPLLSRVSGLNTTIANNIVAHRDNNGQFASRSQLKDVARLGPKAFEQAAGFLRIMNGSNPLDASSVHPEAYSVVKEISAKQNADIKSLMGDTSTLRAVNAESYVNDQFGLPTIKDILKELEKPGRDPRPEFKAATFMEGVEKISDLKDNMILEGVVTNVTNFGAFVDVGVHQDGLVHISAMSDTFISDPRQVVKAGDIVKVKVMEVDVARKRIGLSMRMSDDANEQSEKRPGGAAPQKPSRAARQQQTASKSDGGNNTMAALFAQAQNKNQKGKKRL